ncbi:hypothetical protein DdX_19658 [Ditylenchus destructor]|uniref:Uncharacterized protein n=1 Tax=Ditylenchus destructor TaxID=166010 RepID=A0AAD4MJB7_9BILA|nr:hypothetical protein DdX_19658 [Ditylenchus destructor]
MDEEVSCTFKESYYIVVCMCNQSLTAEEYCRGVDKTVFEAKRLYKAYYIYGVLLSNIYSMYEYYTHFHISPSHSQSDGFLLCNQATATNNIASNDFISSAEFEIKIWSSSYSWMCSTPEEMRYFYNSSQSLYLNFRYKYIKLTERIALFPADLSHWEGTFEDNKCIKIQPSAFHEYCLCMGRNKSERFCKSTASILQKHDEFRNKTDNDQSSSSYSLTSLSTATTIQNILSDDDDDERPDDGWRWQAIQNNYKENIAWTPPPNFTLLMILVQKNLATSSVLRSLLVWGFEIPLDTVLLWRPTIPDNP